MGDIDQCSGPETTFDRYCERYTECADGVEVALCSIPGAGHGSYDNSLDFDLANVAWEMFTRHTLR